MYIYIVYRRKLIDYDIYKQKFIMAEIMRMRMFKMLLNDLFSLVKFL